MAHPQRLEAALFSIDESGIRLVGRTGDPQAVAAARDALARRASERAAEIRDLRPDRPRLVPPSEDGA